MEENIDIFFAGGDALVYLGQHLFGALHLVGTYLRTNFSTPLHTYYVFRVTVTAVGLFQKIL